MLYLDFSVPTLKIILINNNNKLRVRNTKLYKYTLL